MQTEQQPKTPAELPPHSHAVAAQRLGERRPAAPAGVCYAVPTHPPHSRGWHLRRHLKRKRLNRNNQQYVATDRVGTYWSLLPLAFVILVLAVVTGSLLVGYVAFSATVDQRFQQNVGTLGDSLPNESLRMYD